MRHNGRMDVTASLTVACEPAVLFAEVDDLGSYPEWLGLVTRAEPAPGDPDDPGPAWLVELRGRLGPLARSKKLRMVRSVHDSPTSVVFERRELDGRDHAAWRLAADVAETGDGTELVMSLHYSGSFGGQVIERILADEIEAGRPRLAARVLAAP